MTYETERTVHLCVVAYLDGAAFRGREHTPQKGEHYTGLSLVNKQLYAEYFIKGRDNKPI